MLAAELSRHDTHQGQAWSAALEPLAKALADRFKTFLPLAVYPVRVGAHPNTAFALRLALDYADQVGDEELADLCGAKAVAWYGEDRNCQAWEPCQDDFLSATLIEAELMRRALPTVAFNAWLDAYLPSLAGGQPVALFSPAAVSDRNDGKIAHLDGLNLSRAWCWRGLAHGLALHDPRRHLLQSTADVHLAAALAHVNGDYMGEHWLATFALLALLAEGETGLARGTNAV